MPSCAHCGCKSRTLLCTECRQKQSTVPDSNRCQYFSGGSTKVRTDVVSIWERLFESDDSKDVTLVGAEGEEVPAHSLVLCAASEVFKKMLGGGMLEETTKRVEVKDYTAQQLRFFLRLVYTGQVSASDVALDEMEPSLDLVMAALSLSKKYQVAGFAAWLVDRLKPRVNDSTFEDIMIFAIREDCAPLRLYCLRFAETSEIVRDEFSFNAFAAEVTFELQALWEAPARGQKRMGFAY
mmetsp:Transcript_56682/g.184471  ORF Transcript_56682/g.184471 Transcript_56682/m.184471 type:complete len:238 (+) Transcript_56682:61-774(+)